jgi:hypothetical protein
MKTQRINISEGWVGSGGRNGRKKTKREGGRKRSIHEQEVALEGIDTPHQAKDCSGDAGI